MMADIIDYELDRSGKFIPAAVTGTYSFIDKLVSSFSAAIATGLVALIGYKTVCHSHLTRLHRQFSG